MNITRGIIPTAKKAVIYGPEGIGKSTFAAQFPGAVFLDTEGSTVHMDVARLDPPSSWHDITEAVMWCIRNPGELGTLVIDTMDWAEAMAIREVCLEKKVSGIEDIPYGKGYVFVKDKVRGLLELLDRLRASGVNIVLTAHAIVRKFEQPDEMGSFDRYALKLNEKNVAPLVKEWADLLLFANYRTDVVTTQDGKKKATGGKKRVMYTTHAAAWDAKNRFGLEDVLPFEFGSIAHLFQPMAVKAPERASEAPAAEDKEEPARTAEAPETAPETPRKGKGKKTALVRKGRPASMTSEDPEKDAALARLWELMEAARLTDPLTLQAVVAEKEYYSGNTTPNEYDTDFIREVLIEAWESVSKRMESIDYDLPF